jgi:hypothetical protein
MIWVVWSTQVSGNFDLYARAYDGKRWSAVEQLTSAPGSDIFHTMIRDRDGNLYLAYQSSRAGNFDIYLRTYDGKLVGGDAGVPRSATTGSRRWLPHPTDASRSLGHLQ